MVEMSSFQVLLKCCRLLDATIGAVWGDYKFFTSFLLMWPLLTSILLIWLQFCLSLFTYKNDLWYLVSYPLWNQFRGQLCILQNVHAKLISRVHWYCRRQLFVHMLRCSLTHSTQHNLSTMCGIYSAVLSNTNKVSPDASSAFICATNN